MEVAQLVESSFTEDWRSYVHVYHPGSHQGQEHDATMSKAQSYLTSANEWTLEFSKRVLSLS